VQRPDSDRDLTADLNYEKEAINAVKNRITPGISGFIEKSHPI